MAGAVNQTVPFTFQTQEGVDAYNTAAVTLQEIQDRYEQTQRAYEQLQLQYADSQVKLSDLAAKPERCI